MSANWWCNCMGEGGGGEGRGVAEIIFDFLWIIQKWNEVEM